MTRIVLEELTRDAALPVKKTEEESHGKEPPGAHEHVNDRMILAPEVPSEAFDAPEGCDGRDWKILFLTWIVCKIQDIPHPCLVTTIVTTVRHNNGRNFYIG